VVSEKERKRRFVALFESQYDYVYASLLRLGVYESDVEDVAHELFMAVYRKLDDLDESRPIKPWLLAFAARFAADYRRLARHRAGDGDSAFRSMHAASNPEDDASRAEGRSLVMRALDTLSIEVRAVFVAYEIDDLPMKDIAESLGIPVNTAYSRLRLGREQFGAACAAIRGSHG
jgi:RNA polymerase sigma-70 factor (ECF subfamily)